MARRRSTSPCGKAGGPPRVMAHSCLGLLYLAQGELAHAIRVLEPGLALCRASDNRDWLQVIAAGLGAAYALHGHLTEGRALLEEALRESLRTGTRGNRAFWVVRLSEVCRLAGRIEEAWQYAHQALDLARQQQAHGDEALALHQLGTVHAHTHPTDIPPAADPLPAGARAGGGARDAPAPGALPPGPRLALREDSPAAQRARAALSTAARDVSKDGDDVLAPGDRGGPGTGRRTMTSGEGRWAAP